MPNASRPKRLDRQTLIASFLIAVGLVAVVFGVSRSVTGRDQQQLPEAIEAVDPVRGATQVPQQTRVFVDLKPGYRATLAIDGIAIETVDLGDVVPERPAPGEQVTLPPVAIYNENNASIEFIPRQGAAIERFTVGTHTAIVTYWPIVDGEGAARTYTWEFFIV